MFGQIADVLKTLVDYDTIDIALVDETASELVTIFAQDKWADRDDASSGSRSTRASAAGWCATTSRS